jgi:prolyl 4-hydroxylase
MIGYLVAILPIYFFLYIPISHSIYGSVQEPREKASAVLNSSFIADDEPLSCPPHHYNTYILSHEPLVIYIENFLSTQESSHLLNIRYVFRQSDQAMPKSPDPVPRD